MGITHLLLASQSPRRREMMTWLGIPVKMEGADIEESPENNESPEMTAARLAIMKARTFRSLKENAWILAADTVVDLDNIPLGKPANVAQAGIMLRQLRRRPHRVHTGIVLHDPKTNQSLTRVVTTEVTMRNYTDAEIAAYVETGDPLDKAGAYAIQHTGFHPVSHIDRCFANVVGLPLCAVVALLQEWHYALAVDIQQLCRTHFNYPCPATDTGTRL